MHITALDSLRLRLRTRALSLATIALLAVVAVVAAPVVWAHEIGTSRVLITFTAEGEYVIELTADAAALLARLETQSGRPRSGTLPRDSYPDRIASLAPTLRAHADVRFDEVSAWPAFESVRNEQAADPESELRPPTVTVQLRGAVPAGAKDVTWHYDLTSASYALTMRRTDGGPERVEWLEGDQVGQPFALGRDTAKPSRMRLAMTYFRLGFTHILPKGLDHILFVLGIFLFGRTVRPILWQISAFTVAHSITLGLAMYGLVSLPTSVVEPLIAASIVYVAFENLVATDLKPWRVALVFGFGLLHGMGFAGALRELSLPRSEFLTGLLTFNLGVEAGQLTVIAGAFLLVTYWSTDPRRYRRFIVVPGSASIALVGAYWTVTRLLGS